MSNAITYYQNGYTITFNPGDVNYIQNDPFKNLTSPNKGLPFPNSQNIILSPRDIDFSPTTLGNSSHVYSSPLYQDIISLSDYFADWQCSYHVKEGALHNITVQIPWDTMSGEDFSISNFASEQWEIVPNQNQKSVIVNGLLANPFSPPTAVGNYVVLPDVLKVGVQRAYENKTSFITLPTGVATSSAAFLPYAQQILNYVRGGVEGVPSYTQTIKRSAVIDTRNSNNAFNKAVDTIRHTLNTQGTVNYMLSTNDLISGYEIPSDTVGRLLMPSYRKLITVTGLEPTNYYAYAGWLVKQPTWKFITRNKVQITQEFVWDEYIGGLYYIYSNNSQFPLVVNAASNPSGFMPS